MYVDKCTCKVSQSAINFGVCVTYGSWGLCSTFSPVPEVKHYLQTLYSGYCYVFILQGILHVGKHRHGANDLTSGYRCNLILWCRSSLQREGTHLCLPHPLPRMVCTALDRNITVFDKSFSIACHCYKLSIIFYASYYAMNIKFYIDIVNLLSNTLQS